MLHEHQTIQDFNVGSHVELHPCTDQWMMGDRYGEITGLSNKDGVRVRLDKSRKSLWFHPDNVLGPKNRNP